MLRFECVYYNNPGDGQDSIPRRAARCYLPPTI